MRIFTKLGMTFLLTVFTAGLLLAQNPNAEIATKDLTNSVLNAKLNAYEAAGDMESYSKLIHEANKPASRKPVQIKLDGLTAYAYMAYDPNSTIPVGPATFDIDIPGTVTSLGGQTSDNFMCGGSWANDQWYGITFSSGNLYTMDVNTGDMTLIGATGISIWGLAYDVTTSTMFGISDDHLFTIDLNTGEATSVGYTELSGVCVTLACNADGVLYATNIETDQLVTFNKDTGVGTVVGPLGINIQFAQGLEFDHNTNTLYTSAYTTQGELYTIDVTSGAATLIGAFEGGVEMCALAIPTGQISYDNDLGMQYFLEPNTGNDLTATEAVTVTIKNYGVNPQTDFEVSYTINGGTAVTESISTTLNPEEALEYTFTTTADLSEYGVYQFEACVILPGDEDPINDCKPKTVENLVPALCEPQTISGCVFGNGFINFALEQIENLDSGCEENAGLGWSQYFDLGPAELTAGNTYTVMMESGYVYDEYDYATIWIDFDDNFIFTEDEIIVYNVQLPLNGGLINVDFTLPEDANAGVHFMRARTQFEGDCNDPCEHYYFSETEDYLVEVFGAAAEPCEDFDALVVGDYVAEQLGDPWTTWSEAPGGSEDAMISDDFSMSTSNSFVVNDAGIDLIRVLAGEPIETGAWLYSNYIYVPTGYSGYFNIQSDPTPGVEWVVELFFNDDGTGYFAGGSDQTFTYEQDSWILVEINFDLDTDLAQVYFNGNLVALFDNELTIGAVNYYGSDTGGSPGAYYDDVCFGEGYPLTVGLESMEADKTMQLYPNPANDVVYIESIEDMEEVQLWNLSGQLIFTQITTGKKLNINTSQFEAGIYFVKVFSSNSIMTKKLIIE